MWEDGDLDQLLLEEDALLADTNGGADADDEVDEAPLFSEQPQQPQPRPSAMEEPDDDPPQQGSLLEFSQQQRARAVEQAQARQSGSSSRVSYGEVPSDTEDEAVRRWVQAHPQYSHHEDPDPAADDASSVNGGDGQSAGGPEVRQASVPSLSNTNPEKWEQMKKYLCVEGDVVAPVFPHGAQTNGGWLEYAKIFGMPDDEESAENAETTMRPARAMCFNIPKSAFRPDADRLRDMRSSMANQSRATNINTLFGLLWTPVAKGWKSGNHVEDAQEVRQQHGAAGEDPQQQEQERKKKRVEEVDQYMFSTVGEGGKTMEVPMFVIAYEELYAESDTHDAEPTEVVGVRIWKFVLDKDHSDSELVSRLITENRRRMRHAGAAHCSNATRSNKLQQEHNRAIKLVGSLSTENVALEMHAPNQYLRVVYLHDLLNLLTSYGGKTDKFQGYMPLCLSDIPKGALNHPLKGVKDHGGDSFLSPEYVFNAKRVEALEAGLVDFDSTPLNVCHQQREVASYFPEDKNGHFQIPAFCARKSAFWLQTNPSVLHPYDMALPRPIAGIEAPGKELLKLYAERFENWDDSQADPTNDPGLTNRFKNMCTGIDQTTAKAIREATDSIFSFDNTEVSESDRMVASMAKAGAGKDHVGSFEKGAAVIEQRQVLKQLGEETSTVVRKLIAPWEEAERAKIAKGEEKEQKEYNEHVARATSADEENYWKRSLESKQRKFKADYQHMQDRHVMYKRELFNWGAEKFLRAFTSRYDRDSIPTGYRAVWDGLYAELKDMPNGSACVAVAENMQLTDSHKSAYAHAMNFYGRWCEHDCFVRATHRRSNPCHAPALTLLVPRNSSTAATGTSWSPSSS